MKLMMGVTVGAVVGAVIGYMVWGRQVSELQVRVSQLEAKLAEPPPTPLSGNPHSAVIVVTGAKGEKCTAKVDPPIIGNKKNTKVYWIVDHEDAGCVGGNWRLELRFGPASDGTTWDWGPITILRNGTNKFKIPDTPKYKKFPYTVWYIPGGGGMPEPMIDPELEIEM